MFNEVEIAQVRIKRRIKPELLLGYEATSAAFNGKDAFKNFQKSMKELENGD